VTTQDRAAGGMARHLAGAVAVPADDAGEVTLQVVEYILGHLRRVNALTPRQCEAAEELARLYGRGGGTRPWARGDGGERHECEDSRREFAALLEAAPYRCRGALLTLCQGEWVVSYDPLPLWREGLDAVADRLRLAI
jgi:hypothetical protein